MNFAQDAQKLGRFDISALRAIVSQYGEDDWAADGRRQADFRAHASTQTLKLIADADFRHTDPTVHPIFHELEPVIRPLMDHVRGAYLQTLRQRRVAETCGPGYFIRTLLTRLPAGAEIKPHVDEGESLKRCHRIHVPIVTNPLAVFYVGKLKFHMPEGEMWEINNRRTHAVRNDGTEARIHLIMDYVQPGETVFDTEGPLTA
ncbi:aspartyl/asparaginyl beta-hydroxylase domain-containing protein [Asticcacaulis solisilvae]|uniref:aspartyl/asparaginyl beta-hydroxylase domain-containing protein n=1 Tax=Asticcacaulis solisilvae TaxID=1217274 RepID=UPI003FD70334